jgi:hypothetical protein
MSCVPVLEDRHSIEGFSWCRTIDQVRCLFWERLRTSSLTEVRRTGKSFHSYAAGLTYYYVGITRYQVSVRDFTAAIRSSQERRCSTRRRLSIIVPDQSALERHCVHRIFLCTTSPRCLRSPYSVDSDAELSTKVVLRSMSC